MRHDGRVGDSADGKGRQTGPPGVAQAEPAAPPSFAGPVIGYVTEAYAPKCFAHEMERHHTSELGLSPLLGHSPG
jgi:hypothetical protein